MDNNIKTINIEGIEYYSEPENGILYKVMYKNYWAIIAFNKANLVLILPSNYKHELIYTKDQLIIDMEKICQDIPDAVLDIIQNYDRIDRSLKLKKILDIDEDPGYSGFTTLALSC
jgi:hypothetical protein